MGLWTIDMKETLQARNVPPYSFGPLNNPRKYRLFATKHLTQNLCHIVSRSKVQAGADFYNDLTIKWRIYFTWNKIIGKKKMIGQNCSKSTANYWKKKSIFCHPVAVSEPAAYSRLLSIFGRKPRFWDFSKIGINQEFWRKS